MPHDENFCGNRLRLASFLRVVENIPQRPSRSRRRVQDSDEPKHTTQGLTLARSIHPQHPNLIETPGALPNIEAAGMQTGELPDPNPDPPSRMSTDVPLVGTNGMYLSRIGPFAEDKDQPSDSRGQFDERPLSPPRRKDFVVYASNANKADYASHRISSTRRRQLPVNGLALIRASTADGLPAPSGADTAFASPVTDTDPIEDSQIVPYGHAPILKTKPRRVQKPRPNRTHRSGLTNSSTWKSKRGAQQIHLRARGSRKQLVGHGFTTISDGFVGTESSISVKPKRQKISPAKKMEATATNHGLALAKGYLPPPHILPAAPQLDLWQHSPSEIECTLTSIAHQVGLVTTQSSGIHQGSAVHTSTCTSSAQRPNDASTSSPKRATDVEIFHQLSSITAPARYHSDSSSESNEELGVRSEVDDENNDTDDTRSDTDSGVHCHSSQEGIQVEDMPYFENAIHWTHYDGMHL